MKIIYGHVDQGTPKMESLKVWPSRDSNPGRSESNDLLHKATKSVASNPKGLEFFFTTNFEGP